MSTTLRRLLVPIQPCGPVSEACVAAATHANPERLTDRQLETDLLRWVKPTDFPKLCDYHFLLLYRHCPAAQRAVLQHIYKTETLLLPGSHYREAVLFSLECTLPALQFFAYLIELGEFFHSYRVDWPSRVADTERRACALLARKCKVLTYANLQERLPRLVPGSPVYFFRFNTERSLRVHSHPAVQCICTEVGWGSGEASAGSYARQRVLVSRVRQALGEC